jgi:ferritin-like metal-binding protein YciE
MRKIVDLRDLFVEQLRDLYHGEAHVLKELYRLPDRIQDTNLKNSVRAYLDTHEDQIMRLRQVFDLQFEQKRGEVCKAMYAMVDDILDLSERCADPEVFDAGLVVALQHIMHYKIAGYGAVSTYARQIGYLEEAAILHKNLEEEQKFDRKLALMADAIINARAIEPQI